MPYGVNVIPDGNEGITLYDQAGCGPALWRPLGAFKDTFGHSWGFATHKEDLSPEEIGERAKTAHGG